jgi:putative AlgH/UPF0301 family transcriptional regulator
VVPGARTVNPFLQVPAMRRHLLLSLGGKAFLGVGKTFWEATEAAEAAEQAWFATPEGKEALAFEEARQAAYDAAMEAEGLRLDALPQARF